MKEMLTNYISRYSAFGLKMEVQKRDKTGFSIIGQQLPILRPGDDVRNEITHGGHRLVPLVGCAAIVFKCSPDQVAFDKEIGVAYRLGPLHIPAIKLMYLPETGDFSACYLNGEHYPIYSYHRLYDYLDSLLIDYRGLIGEGLAVKAADQAVAVVVCLTSRAAVAGKREEAAVQNDAALIDLTADDGS